MYGGVWNKVHSLYCYDPYQAFCLEVFDMKRRMKQFCFTALGCAVILSAGSALAQDSTNVSSFLQDVIAEGNLKLEEARASSDVAQMDCLNAILIQAKGFLNVAQTSEMNLMDAQQRNDEAGIAHNQKLLSLAYSKGQELSLSMKQCATGLLTNDGETSLKSSYQCKYEPCKNDPDFEADTREGNTAYEQALIDQIIQSTISASPYL